MGHIVRQSLKDQRRSLFFWSSGIVLTIALIILFYPSVKESATDLQTYIENLPEALRAAFIGEADYASPVGYLTSELFSFMMPLLLIIFTVAAGSGAVAGEEDKGTLDILLANPIPRWQVILEKFTVMVIASSFLGAVAATSLIIGMPLADMNIGGQRVIDIMVSTDLLALTFGTFALFLGSATGNRAFSIGLSTAVAVGTFLLNVFAPVVDFLENYQKFSPFYHYMDENPLEVGLKADHVMVLVAAIFLLLCFSLVAFQRRDLRI